MRANLETGFIAVVDSVQLGYIQTDQRDGGCNQETAGQQHHLVVGVESSEVGRHEDHPDESSGRDTDERVPGLVEVLWQAARQESMDGAHQKQEQIEGEGGEHGPWQDLTHTLHEPFGR